MSKEGVIYFDGLRGASMYVEIMISVLLIRFIHFYDHFTEFGIRNRIHALQRASPRRWSVYLCSSRDLIGNTIIVRYDTPSYVYSASKA